MLDLEIHTDRVHFGPLDQPTPGAANSTPLVGPVVINEIMYKPGYQGDEFIELYNPSDSPVDLSVGERPREDGPVL